MSASDDDERARIRVRLTGGAAERAQLRRALAGSNIVIVEDEDDANDTTATLALEPQEVPVRSIDLAPEPLTSREQQVLELVAEGLPNKAIASRLGISDQTVKFHVAAIYGKLGARNRTDAVRLAIRRGLITV